MGTIRDFMRKKRLKEEKVKKKKLATEYSNEIVYQYYKELDALLKIELYQKDHKKLWQDVNKNWNVWLATRLKSIKDPHKKLAFKSVIERSLVVINKSFQEKKDEILNEQGDKNENSKDDSGREKL